MIHIVHARCLEANISGKCPRGIFLDTIRPGHRAAADRCFSISPWEPLETASCTNRGLRSLRLHVPSKPRGWDPTPEWRTSLASRPQAPAYVVPVTPVSRQAAPAPRLPRARLCASTAVSAAPSLGSAPGQGLVSRPALRRPTCLLSPAFHISVALWVFLPGAVCPAVATFCRTSARRGPEGSGTARRPTPSAGQLRLVSAN